MKLAVVVFNVLGTFLQQLIQSSNVYHHNFSSDRKKSIFTLLINKILISKTYCTGMAPAQMSLYVTQNQTIIIPTPSHLFSSLKIPLVLSQMGTVGNRPMSAQTIQLYGLSPELANFRKPNTMTIS